VMPMRVDRGRRQPTRAEVRQTKCLEVACGLAMISMKRVLNRKRESTAR
jgi:hypothetical protein